MKFVEYKIEGSNRPSIIWMKFDDHRIGKATRQKYFQRGFYSSNIQRDWTPVFEVERTYLNRFKMYQRIQFPLRSKKISNDQELIQSDPISCPENQKGNN